MPAPPLRFLARLLLPLALLSGSCGSQGGAGGSGGAPVEPALFGEAAPRPEPLRIRGGIGRWDEGLPLGNGRLGVLVWGEGDTVRLSLDRGDLWDLRRPETVLREDWTYATMRAAKEAGDHARHVELFDVPYDTVATPTKLPGARLELKLEPGYRIDGFVLDLANGVVDVNVSRALTGEARASSGLRVGVHPTLERVSVTGFSRDGAPVLVRPGGLDGLGYPAERRVAGTEDAEHGWAGFEQDLNEGRMALAVAWGTSAPPQEGMPNVRALHATLAAGGAGEAVLEPALAAMRAAARSYGGPSSRFREYAAADRPFVELPDERLQFLYDLAAYLYRSAAAAGAPPMPLQGLWTADEGGLPPWKGDYHNDLNTQMTYRPYLTGNLLEQGWTWLEFNEELLPAYRRFAEEFFGLSEGAAAIPGVMALNGDPLGGWGQYSLSPTNGAWIAWQFAEAWRTTRDDAFLRESAAPFAFAIGRGLVELLEADEAAGGALRLPLSSSPEIHDNRYEAWLPPNSNYDQALLLALFTANAELARALGDDAEAALWERVLEQLEPLDADPNTGALTFARGVPYAESHRHFSHAMAIHPLGLISTRGGEAERERIAATLEDLDAHGTQAWVGYSFAWAAAMNARAQRPERALERLEQFVAFTGPNGFHLNGDQSGQGLSGFTYRPFTLEGNFMAMDAIHEMLLFHGRSDAAGTLGLELFPAVPEAWSDVRFERLRGKDGLVVSARREGGATRALRIEATVDASLRLLDPFADSAEPPVRWSPAPSAREGDWLRFELASGQVLEASF